MSSDVAIRVEGVAKRYRIFARPFDRLLHQLFGLCMFTFELSSPGTAARFALIGQLQGTAQGLLGRLRLTLRLGPGGELIDQRAVHRLTALQAEIAHLPGLLQRGLRHIQGKQPTL